MKRTIHLLLSLLLLPVALPPAPAQAQTRSYSAAELIAGVKAAKPTSAVYARLRMEHAAAGGKALVLQLQVKRRPLPDGGVESLYHVLFPKERKGEGLLLRTRRGSFTGATFVPGRGLRPLQPTDRDTGLFGTALTIEDILAGFLDWPAHEIVGREKEGAVPCTIVESRPARTAASGIGRVRSWIDESRLAAMRIEFFGQGAQPVKTVTTQKVLRGSSGYFAPVTFTVTDHARGASTRVEGVRSDAEVSYGDSDFTEAALQAGPTVPAKNGP